MKKLLYFLLIFPALLNSQAVCHDDHSEEGPSDVSGKNVDGNLQLNTYTSHNSNIKGSPFAFSDWSSGDITTTNHSSIKYDKIQFDLEKNQILVFKKGSKTPTAIPNNQIISLKANDSKKIRYFASIKPTELNGITKGKLYELLSNANDYLIKETSKYISKSNDPSEEGAKKMIYKKKTVYYIKNKSGKYVETKLNKKHIMKLLKDKEDDVKAYISKNKLSFNENDVPKILKYYYSLS